MLRLRLLLLLLALATAAWSPWGTVALHGWGGFLGQTPSRWSTAARALALLSTAAFAHWKLFPV